MRRALALLLALGAAAPAAAAKRAPVHLWPLVTYEPHDDGVEVDYLFSLGAYTRHGADKSLRFAPLYWHWASPQKTHSLFVPLYGYKRADGVRRLGIIGYPPVSLVDLERGPGERRDDRWLLARYRRDEEGSSFDFYPILSTTRKENAGSFNVFPLFARAWNRDRGYSRTSFIGFADYANLFEWRRDDVRELREGHTLLYWWRSAPKTRDRVFFPVWWHLRSPERRVTHLWPLYGKSVRGSRVEHATVWPLFRVAKDSATATTESAFVWPLGATLRSPRRGHSRFFPLWGWDRYENAVDEPSPWQRYAPVPLLYRLKGPEHSFLRLFWLAWFSERAGKRGDIVLTYYRFDPTPTRPGLLGVFPLFHRTTWPDASFTFALPTWVSYRSPERVFRALFPLYAHHRSPKRTWTAAPPLYMDYASERGAFRSLIPFFFRSRNAARDTELLYVFPFYGRYTRGATFKRHMYLFPLFGRVDDPSGQVRALDLLWPLFHWETRPEYRSVRVFPFYVGLRDADLRFATVPPLFWNYRRGDTAHMHVFPFYGRVTRGDSLRFEYALGPLWMRTTRPARREKRVDLLGSLFSRSSGPHFTRTRLWPLYGAETGERGRSSTYLLGFSPKISLIDFENDPPNRYKVARVFNVFHRAEGPRTTSVVFPLYWGGASPEERSSMLLPVWDWKKRRAGSGHLSLVGIGPLSLFYRTWNSPEERSGTRFLNYFVGRKPGAVTRVFFPLWAAHTGQELRWRSLFPLVHWAHRREEIPEFSLGVLGFSPVLSLFHYEHDGGDAASRLWPLWLYDKAQNPHERELDVLAVWPGIGLGRFAVNPEETVRRFIPLFTYKRERDRVKWSALWPLVIRSKAENGDRALRILWRLVRSEQEGPRRVLEVNPFWYRSSDPDDGESWAVLGGLFGVDTAPDGTRRYRFLWVF